MNVHIGTSGFQYPEWKGGFYPENLAKAKMLPYYADHFSTTEINYSFRHVPSTKTLEGWNALTPKNFVFSLKAPQKITHFAKLKNCHEEVEFFHRQVSHLGAKLGCILFQLPPTLPKDTQLLENFLAEKPSDMRAAFEFRHESWFDDKTFAILRAGGAALCVAESADLATPLVSTANFGYLRLRREDYIKGDLARWAQEVKARDWSDVFIYFKHEETGVGPQFAALMQGLMGGPA